MKMIPTLFLASCILTAGLQILALASLASDGDPDFIVGVRGLAQPLCFRLEGEPGQVVRLLQDPESGVVVNARISRPVPDSPRTYLSAVLIARRNFRVVAKVGRVLVNRYRFAWGPVSVRRVHGHRVLIAPTLLALTLRNMNVTLIVKRHLPEGRRPSATDTDNNSSPNIAFLSPDVTPRHHNGSNVVIAARATRRRVSRRRRPDDIDHGPRQRNRRHRRPPNRRRKKTKGGKGNSPLAKKSRSKRETENDVDDFENIVGLSPRLTESSSGRLRRRSDGQSSAARVGSVFTTLDNDVDNAGDDFEHSYFHNSAKHYRELSRKPHGSDLIFSDEDSRKSTTDRSRRSSPTRSRNSSRRRPKSSREASESTPRGSRSRGGSRRSPKRRWRRPASMDGSGKSSPGRLKKSGGRNSRRSSGSSVVGSSSDATPAQVVLRQSDDAGRNVSASGDDVSSGNDGSSGGMPMRDMAAYVGFYVADARDLSSQTHGLLGQFLHKAVTLQRVRQKTNGVMKARLLVERPRPHHVKATLRTRTNMALNSSSTCWWLREGGLGVVDGVYTDYLVSRFRDTDFLPLPPGLIGQ
ncbi:hypothetical protein ACOMHN_061742 [Nucella lapillus]